MENESGKDAILLWNTAHW